LGVKENIQSDTGGNHMKIISVTGGKGGTGKTLVATNLAWLLSRKKKTMLVDIDVDNPCTYTFFNVHLTKTRSIVRFKPIIDKEKCTLCGKCTATCPTHALILIPKKNDILYIPSLCEGCALCYYVCPEQAILEGKDEIGYIYEGRKDNIYLIVGELKVGQRASIKVMLETLSHSMERAKEYQYEYVVIDTPPGTSSGIYRALSLSNKIILVTEPTTLGIHDLKRMLRLLKDLKDKEIIMVVNKYGIRGGAYEELSSFIKGCKLDNIVYIPYDAEIPKHYAKGKIIVKKYGDKLTKAFNEILRFAHDC